MPYWFDGNNLIGQPVALARADRATRRAFLNQLSTFSRQRGGRFLVFFDGDDPDRAAMPPGVQVRYSAPISTDEAILRKLGECRTPTEVIVVTNDRTLGRRCRDAGARMMAWREFMSRMKPASSGRKSARGVTDEKVNLDEWVRYFGYDKTILK